jgi:hypothetical protein
MRGGSYARTTDHVKTGSARLADFDDDIVHLLNGRGLNSLSGLSQGQNTISEARYLAEPLGL